MNIEFYYYLLIKYDFYYIIPTIKPYKENGIERPRKNPKNP